MNSGKLYVVSTPIGNLGDITFRAIEILKNVDIVLCEDTRETKKIFKFYNIKNKLESFFEGNENRKIKKVLDWLLREKNIALVSDSGTPLISDPGFQLVRELKKNRIPVIPIPGSSSILSALSSSGLPTDRFFFQGFLPKKKGRTKLLLELSSLSVTIIIFESQFRIIKTIEDIYSCFGNRMASLCREMTKKFEEIITTDLLSLSDIIKRKKIKGEIVLLIAKDGFQVNEKK